MAEQPRKKGIRAGFGIRLLASGYDSLILFGLLFIAFSLITLAENYLGTMQQWLKGSLIIVIAYAYFAGFWVKGGATTGMRPWKLRIVMNETGEPLSWVTASVRFIGLMITWLALGMTLWYIISKDTGHFLFFVAAVIPAISMATMAITRERSPLHDLIAGTGIFRVE
ncbi:MAG: RDD family protein [Zetaproteobacteria bacterium CG12_big_fil_rev_8_21_14_0_65_54_13]|nr:MAG: RDD family protein [Zetaproteobacteria bacterium CG12_big_fil_rev_8_21_14_0_65_54_13]